MTNNSKAKISLVWLGRNLTSCIYMSVGHFEVDGLDR